MRNKALSLLILLLITGCTTLNIKPVQRMYEKSDNFKIGEIQEKTLGEEMLVRQDVIGELSFIIQYDYQPPSEMGVVFPVLKQGTIWIARGILESGDFVCWSNPSDLYRGIYYPTILENPANDTPWYLIVRKDNTAYGIMNAGGYIFQWPEVQKSFVKPDIWASNGSFKEVFLYNGKSQNTIKIQYREYKNDFARQAFYQDLTYDLSESKTIGFKGMTIDIIEATNSKIKFIVRKGLEK